MEERHYIAHCFIWCLYMKRISFSFFYMTRVFYELPFHLQCHVIHFSEFRTKTYWLFWWCGILYQMTNYSAPHCCLFTRLLGNSVIFADLFISQSPNFSFYNNSLHLYNITKHFIYSLEIIPGMFAERFSYRVIHGSKWEHTKWDWISWRRSLRLTSRILKQQLA